MTRTAMWSAHQAMTGKRLADVSGAIGIVPEGGGSATALGERKEVGEVVVTSLDVTIRPS